MPARLNRAITKAQENLVSLSAPTLKRTPLRPPLGRRSDATEKFALVISEEERLLLRNFVKVLTGTK
jgi:hypothetical protein